MGERLLQEVQVVVQPHAVDFETAGRIVGVPAWTIYEAVCNGSLPAKCASTRSRSVKVADLLVWFEGLPAATPAPSLMKRKSAGKIQAGKSPR